MKQILPKRFSLNKKDKLSMSEDYYKFLKGFARGIITGLIIILIITWIKS